jgi:hypothetical protein
VWTFRRRAIDTPAAQEERTEFRFGPGRAK